MAEDGISVAWEGLSKLYEAIEKMAEGADEAAREIVAKSAAVAEAAIKGNFAGTHKRGQPHVGGDQPNVVTGTLRRSIRADTITRFGRGDYGTVVGPRTVYARRVELGYRGSRGYPYVKPGYEHARPEMAAVAREVWARFLRP